MRTLEINKTSLWCCLDYTSTDEKDTDGNYTGETTKTYSDPVEVKLSLYPSAGKIIEQIFGKDANFDMIAVSNDVVLNKNSLLFLTEPTDNYDTTYDYSVSDIKTSLNTYQYGLKRRT